MEVIVTLEHRFVRTPDGRVWSRTMFSYAFWQRYLEVFDSVKVVARVRDVSEVDASWKEATGLKVRFHAVPYYHGLSQFLRRYRAVKKAVEAAYDPNAAVILRVGSTIGAFLIPVLRKRNHPFGVEVVGDPWDVFSPGAVRHPLRPLIRRLSAARLRRQCRQAAAATYVTQFALQRRYPPAPDAFATYFSDVELPTEAFAMVARRPEEFPTRLRLITVGSLETMYKGVDVLIDAVASCRDNGVNIELVVVGDGKHRTDLEQQANARGIGALTSFRGQLSSGASVRQELSEASLFVLASRTEGLPRALIEAMAMALPCIGTRVGGIPELLAPEDLCNPDDVTDLAAIVSAVAGDRLRLSNMSSRNLTEASKYREDLLRERRQEFYRVVRSSAEVTNRPAHEKGLELGAGRATPRHGA